MNSKSYPYIHRDLSWLDFNYRVLQEAKDKNVPLLERLKFLAIYSSNLEEFFRVRVANHRNLVRAGKKTSKEMNYEPSEVLEQILYEVNNQLNEFSKIFEKDIVPALKKNNIHLVNSQKITKAQTAFIDNYFNEYLLPIAQPILLVEKRIKPFLSNGALYLALFLQENDSKKTAYGIVKVGSDVLPRFIQLPSSKKNVYEVMLLGDMLRRNLNKIFPGYKVIDSYSIKLTRDAELYIDDEYSGNLIEKIKKNLNKRNIGPASRLVYDRKMPKAMLDNLMNVFDLSTYDLLPEGRYHNNADFIRFPDFGLQQLKDTPIEGLKHHCLEESASIFEAIGKADQMIFVPYHRYKSVIKFFEDAATDPKVTHIKIIQYRVAKISKIMDALKLAVKNGKKVSAFIEVKARFDEEANLRWGEELEQAGATVNYSMPGLKVHSKMAIIRRIEHDIPKFYAYTSTGNFHEGTVKIYSDIGLFTCDERITKEAVQLFNFLETKIQPDAPFEHLGVGLFNLREKFVFLIKREINYAKMGKEARMTIKLNSLQDTQMINLLYEASMAGVKINLIIRGICSLIPGIKGISDNIFAISIIDKYLEHARLFYFYNNGNDEMYFSSADWMERNLSFRVETLVPVYNQKIKEQIKKVLEIQLQDNVKARLIQHKKTNEFVVGTSEQSVRSQIELHYYFKSLNE